MSRIFLHIKFVKAVVILSVFAFILIFSIGYNMVHHRYNFENAFFRTVFLWGEGTNWAKGFSEERFSMLQLGMKKKEVIALIGEPLRKTCDSGGCEWVYTWQKTSVSDFDRRDVIFNESDQIIKIRHEFFLD
jgi:hypothetical protein